MVMGLYTQVVCFHKSTVRKTATMKIEEGDENKVKYEGNNNTS